MTEKWISVVKQLRNWFSVIDFKLRKPLGVKWYPNEKWKKMKWIFIAGNMRTTKINLNNGRKGFTYAKCAHQFDITVECVCLWFDPIGMSNRKPIITWQFSVTTDRYTNVRITVYAHYWKTIIKTIAFQQ